MRPDGARQEITRLERLRVELAPRVTGGDREARSDQLREAWRRNHPGGTS